MSDSHTFTVRLFAILKDKAGASTIDVALNMPATIADLLAQIEKDWPALMPALPTCVVAVNQAFAEKDILIHEEDELAIFPPVSGGSGSPYPTYFAITSEPPDIPAIYRTLTQPDVGAIATFTGFVRGQTQKKGLPPETLHLEYEAYAGMAEAKMCQISEEIWEKWTEVKGIAIVQRVGRLSVGEITTFVACASGHRDQGIFPAARYGIDRLKEIVPVWKKEVGPDQSVWVEGHYQPTNQDN